MKVFESTNQLFSASVQGDAVSGDNSAVACYGLSRSMLRLVRGGAPQMWAFASYFTINGTTTAAPVYYTAPDGTLELPLKNLVNKVINAGYSSFGVQLDLRTIDDPTVLDTVSFTVNVFRGISYNDMLAPRKKWCLSSAESNQNIYVLPPNIMYNPNRWTHNRNIIFESNYPAMFARVIGGVGVQLTPQGDRQSRYEVPNTATAITLTNSKPAETYTWELDAGDNCGDFVCIDWTSLTGVQRRHWFPVVSFLNGVDSEASIITAGDGFDVRKNAFKGAKCRITGLTPYSCWYYQDLLQASDAHCIIVPTWNSFDTEMASPQTACYVSGGMEAVPEGNGFYSLEFTIKLRHYDTF